MTSEPMIQRTPAGQRDADRPDPVAPGGRADDDGQPEDGEADAVAAVLGGQRLGLVRAGHRAGQAAGAAGEQVPAAAGDAARGRSRRSSCGRRAGVAVEERFAGGRFLLAAVEPERPRPRDGDAAGRRVDVLRAGMRRTVIARAPRTGQAEGRVPHVARRRGPYRHSHGFPLPYGSWPTPITSELVVRAAARLGEVRRRRGRRVVVGVAPGRGRPDGDRPPGGRRHRHRRPAGAVERPHPGARVRRRRVDGGRRHAVVHRVLRPAAVPARRRAATPRSR